LHFALVKQGDWKQVDLNRDFIEKLELELQKKLPGEDAQFRMAPTYRPWLSKEEILKQNPRPGGVMLLLYEKNGELYIVFTQRKDYKGVHGGQMSFPGGKKDEGDVDLIETALRETREEIGIARDQIKVLGKLSELYVMPSNFMVYPAVGFAEKIEGFSPQKDEVEKIVEIPLAFFLDHANINPETEIKLFTGMEVKVPAYVYGAHVIWGATAIILSEFIFIVERMTL
jgi:8-oxo-dGTP pyrophosphatase MutT (NUDIX family)